MNFWRSSTSCAIFFRTDPQVTHVVPWGGGRGATWPLVELCALPCSCPASCCQYREEHNSSATAAQQQRNSSARHCRAQAFLQTSRSLSHYSAVHCTLVLFPVLIEIIPRSTVAVWRDLPRCSGHMCHCMSSEQLHTQTAGSMAGSMRVGGLIGLISEQLDSKAFLLEALKRGRKSVPAVSN